MHDEPAVLERDSVVRELLGVPAGADTEDEAPAGDLVERGDRFGGRDRVALCDQADPGRELDPGGHGGRGGEGDERVVQVGVFARQVPAAGERRLAAAGDVRVLWKEK